jgi:hypothetical protein
MILFSAMLVSMIVTPVVADDCLTDPLNAQDCLRTAGYAEAMAGLVAAILSILINGPIILQTLLLGGNSGGGGGEIEPPESGPDDGGPFYNADICFDEGF